MIDLLSRLDGVRETGKGKFSAKCPAHDDRSPSLSVKECSDGRILLHCFAGCHVEDVLAALGLSFSDLMLDAPNTHRQKPQRWLNASDALATLDHESLVVAFIGADFLAHKALAEDVWNRLALAVNRINDTRAEYARCRK